MHALAMHGKPALPADFQSFPYANPDAPKGGRISYGWQGSFDSLNPFIVLGDGARGLFDAQFGNNVFDTLMLMGCGVMTASALVLFAASMGFQPADFHAIAADERASVGAVPSVKF